MNDEMHMSLTHFVLDFFCNKDLKSIVDHVFVLNALTGFQSQFTFRQEGLVLKKKFLFNNVRMILIFKEK